MADNDLLQDNDEPSRSQLKRDHQAIQNLVKQLADNPGLLPDLDCSDALRDGVELLSRMKPSSARNRQVRHLAKLLANDYQTQASIEQAMQQLEQQSLARNALLHRAEYWRDSLLQDSSQLPACVNELPGLAVQRVRQILREIAKGGAEQRITRLRRELFRLLRDAIEG